MQKQSRVRQSFCKFEPIEIFVVIVQGVHKVFRQFCKFIKNILKMLSK